MPGRLMQPGRTEETSMDRIALLCEKDSIMLTEFSRRSLDRMTGRSLRGAHLPFVGAYLDANVKKEVEKDRLIIEHAGASFSTGRELDVDAVFEETKGVDKLFVRNLAIPALSITVRYSDIAEVRKKRIAALSGAVRGILAHWKDDLPLDDALRAAYPEQAFGETLREILHLYNQETRLLSRSIRLFPPFNGAVEFVADTLFETMEKVSVDLVAEYSNKIFGGKLTHVQA